MKLEDNTCIEWYGWHLHRKTPASRRRQPRTSTRNAMHKGKSREHAKGFGFAN